MYLTLKAILLLANIGITLINGQDYYESTVPYCTPNKNVLKNLLEQYDTEKSQPNESQTEVIVQLWIQRVNSLNIIRGSLDLTLIVTETWMDKELSYEHQLPCKDNVKSTMSALEKIWTPKLRFVNSLHTYHFQAPLQDDFVMIYPNGTISRNYKISLVTPCTTNLRKYPMFNSRCNLILQSFYNVDEIKLNSSDNPIIVLDAVLFPEYKKLINVQFSSTVASHPWGDFTMLKFDMIFKRLYGWNIIHIYGPSMALVFCSWISFCLGTVVTARVLLTFGSLLALMLQYCYAIKDIPHVAYMTYLDIWMSICVKFVLASIMELALFALVARCYKNKNSTNWAQIENETSSKPLISETNSDGKNRPNAATIVDIVFAIFFPIAFFIIIIIYFYSLIVE